MSDRVVFHVVPNADRSKWVVTRENDDSFRQEFSTKAEAEQAAKERARREPLGQVKVHKSEGNMEYESTYGEDPRQSPG